MDPKTVLITMYIEKMTIIFPYNLYFLFGYCLNKAKRKKYIRFSSTFLKKKIDEGGRFFILFLFPPKPTRHFFL